MAEEVVRHLVLSLPLICECAKEKRCINATVDGIVAVNIRGDIERVQNVRCTLEAAYMILGKQDRRHGRTNRSELLREVEHATRGEEMIVMPPEPFEC